MPAGLADGFGRKCARPLGSGFTPKSGSPVLPLGRFGLQGRQDRPYLSLVLRLGPSTHVICSHIENTYGCD